MQRQKLAFYCTSLDFYDPEPTNIDGGNSNGWGYLMQLPTPSCSSPWVIDLKVS